MASSAWAPRSAQMAAHRFEHRRRPARVDGCRGSVVALERDLEKVGDVTLVAAMPVLEREAHLLAGSEQLQAARVGLVAEAQERAPGDPLLGEVAAEDRDRRHSDPAADHDRAGGARVDLVRLGEGAAQRPRDGQFGPRLERRQDRRSGADGLDQELQADAVSGALGGGDREGARQERAASLGAPAVGAQHVELPRRRVRAVGVERGEDDVATRLAPGHDIRRAGAERSEDAGTHEIVPRASTPWSSCRLWGSAPRVRTAWIALATAEAPVIVVMQGTPPRTAAFRIS